MKATLLAVTLFLIAFHTIHAQTPTLGTYPATSVLTAGDNAIVTPSVAPVSTTSIVAYTTTRFKGTLHVNPATGVLNVTNAQPTGTYTITIKAFNGAATSLATCIITVGGNVCSQGFLSNAANVSAGSSPNIVVVADFNSDGNQDLAVTNYNSGTVSIRLGNGGGGFTGTLNIGMGLYSGAMEVADLNGDGKQDLAVCSAFGNTMSIRLGDGTGDFGPLSTLSTGEYPRSIAVGDFNKDGKPDLAIAAVGNVGFVAIKFGDGAGGFTNGPNAAITGTPQRVAIADFNNDGNIDLAVSLSSTGGQGGIAIRLGDGTGNFSGTYNAGVNTSDVQSVAIGDMNGDGNQDLITTTFSSSGYVYVSLGNGVGFFNYVSSKYAGNNPNGVIVADFNGDGKQDAATANYNGNSIAMLLGDGAGGLGDAFTMSVTGFSSTPSSLAAGDFNEDGVMDMAVANAANNGGIAVLQGRIAEVNVRGNGSDIADGNALPSTADHTDFGNVSNRITRTFTIQNTGDGNLTVKNIVISGADALLFERAGITLPATILPGASATFTIRFIPQTQGLKKVTVNILNDDCDEGIYDFAIQGNAVAVVPVLGSYAAGATVKAGGNLLITPSAAPANAISIIAGVSPNFKGQLSVDSITGIVKIINANPAGTYTAQVKAFNGFSSSTTSFAFTVASPVCSNPGGATNLPIANQSREAAIADFNGDGKQDLAVISGSTILLRYGNDSANFTNGPTISVSASALAAGDVNGDGKPDLLAINNSSNSLVTVLLATMPGNFINAGTVPVGASPNGIAIADFNNDGKPDFIVSNYTGNSVSVRLGDLTGSFTGTTDIAMGGLSGNLVTGDFNGDGNTDFAATTGSNSVLFIRLGDGAGNFTARPNIPLPSNGSQLVMADFNGDGKQDLACSHYQAGNISIRLGDGAGNFSGITSISLTMPLVAIATADYNGDGKPDIIAGHGTKVSVRLGDGVGSFSGATNINSDADVRSVVVSDFNNDGKQDLAIGYYRSSPLSEYIGIRTGGENDADIRGNSSSISDGSNTTSVSNHTDFGTGSSTTRTFTIHNTGLVNLNIEKISISGVDSALFTVSARAMPLTIPAGSSDTFRVSFTPQTTGLKAVVVTVYNDDCDEGVYDFAISGMALSAVTGTYPATVIASAGANAVVTPSSLPANTTSIIATTSANFKGLIQVDSITGNLTVINAHPEGNYTVTVRAFNNQVATTTSFSLRVNSPVCSQGLLTGTNISLTAFNPTLIAVGDFNNDRKQDFALLSANSSNVAIRLGDGNGGITGTTLVDVGVVPSAIAIADFNGDGRQDFAVTNTNDFFVRVRMGNGAGSFTTAANVLINTYASSLVVADFTGDGKPDIATGNSYSSYTIGVLPGNGMGGFTTGSTTSITYPPSVLVAADFNNDGKADLAVMHRTNSSVSVMSGNGAGGFTGTALVAVGQGPAALVTADFNNDGLPDFATANTGSNNVTVQLNTGGNIFAAATASISVSYPQGLAIADFNADGKQDVVVTAYNGATATVCLGLGNGSFADFSNITTPNYPQGVVTGDFNSDGRQDFATANGSGSITIASGAVNDINLKGNNVSIPDGNTSPSVANNTDFGNVSSSAVRTFIVQNTGPVKLIVSAVALAGQDSTSFYLYGTQLPATILAGDSLSFKVGFVPVAPGVKTTMVVVKSNDCDEAVYKFTIQATGQIPSVALGNYPSASIAAAGGNAVVSPSSAPINTANITAIAPANFKGSLQVDSITGAVRITNAHPAGTYPITVKVNGLSPLTKSFVLTVGNAVCSQALFSGNTNLSAFDSPAALQTADFNNDGKQDLVYAGSGNPNVRLGDGAGNFGNTISPPYQFYSLRYMAIGDYNGDGNQDVAVTGGSAKVYIYLGNGTGNLVKTEELSITNGTGGIASADFNGDGKLDLAVSLPNNNMVSVYQGNGAGGFSFISQTPTGNTPSVIAVADFNNDGFPDFAVTAQAGNSVSIRLGTGNGSFVGTYEVPATNPLSVSTSDVNGDGNTDIVISNYANNTGTVTVRVGDGAGSFSGTTGFSFPAVVYATAGGDFNGDGNVDIIVSITGTSSVAVLLGDGLGNFTTGPLNLIGSGSSGAIVADFNGDGRQDLALNNQSGSTISIRLGNTNEINVKGNNLDIPDSSTIVSPSNFTDFENVSSNLVRTFTIQNTGLVALTVSNINFSGGDFSSFIAGGISLPATIAAGASATFTINFVPTLAGLKTTTVNIFNNDCNEAIYDFALQGTGVAVVPALGNYPATTIATAGGNAVINPSVPPTNAGQISAYTSADFKGILQVNPVTGAVTVTNAQPAGVYNITVKANGIVSTMASFTLTVNNAGCSQGLFSGTTNTTISNYNFAIAVADFNGDGRQDFATTNHLNNYVSIGLGDGTGNFNAVASVSTGPYPRAIAISDFNNDGKQDFVTANYNGNSVSIRLGNGAGGFTGTVNMPVGAGPQAIAAGDFNSDGKPDFVTANYNANTITVYFGDGAGSFYGRQDVTVGTNPNSLVVNDFNSDGSPDLAVTNYTSNTVSIRLGDGLGGFNAVPDVAAGSGPISITTNDFNGDGNQDIAISDNGNGFNGTAVAIRLGNGSGGFSNVADVDFGIAPLTVTTGDFNGDGKADLAGVWGGTGNIAIRLGTGTGSFTSIANIIVGDSPRGIAVGDFNGDGRQDFATANNSASNTTIRLNSDREINLTGNGNTIPDGSVTPTAATLTDFGTVSAGSSLVRTYTIQNTGTSNLIISSIAISGADSALFAAGGISLPLTVAARSSTTFTLSFSAVGNGIKTTKINISSNDCDESVYDFVVRGNASCSPSSTTNIWLGNTADWNSASNWSLNFVPSECTKVVINAGVPFMPEITNLSSACYSLTLNNGATITIKTGGHLNITSNN